MQLEVLMPNNMNKIDYHFLLYFYVVCADRQEHIKETQALAQIAGEHIINEKTQEEAEKILSQQENMLPLDVVIKSIPDTLRISCLENCAYLAYVDGFCHPLERELLKHLADEWGVSESELDRMCASAEALANKNIDTMVSLDYSQQFTTGEKIIAGINKLFGGKLLPMFASFKSDLVQNTLGKLEHKILLSGPEYDKAIERCREVANEDITFAIPALSKTRESLKNLQQELEKPITEIAKIVVGKDQEHTQEVVTFLQETEKSLVQDIFKKIETINASIHKKQSATQYFTISFLGKTKAGKSTLHAVITGGGEEAIGAGKQRKTRLNRVYEWKNIRIIDTPGIGAPGGKTDESIAERIIDESDVICFVLTNNNQQKTEFAFLEKLKNKAKPLIILLNVQENLTHPRKIEKFLENPSKTFSVKDKSALGGHFDRINRYAKEHYGNDYFDIIPVQLYAALISQKPEYSSQQHALLKASRLTNFLDSLKLSLIRDGEIRRSQTLLGCTVGEIEPIIRWIAERVSVLKKNRENLQIAKKRVNCGTAEFSQQAQKDLQNGFGKVFQELRGSIPRFAEEHCEPTESYVQSEWKDHAEKHTQKLDAIYRKVMNTYVSNVEELLSETASEISLLGNFEFKHIDIRAEESSMFAKNFLKFGGGVMGLLGTIAWGVGGALASFAWPLIIVGGVMSILSNFFKSKAKKRQEAISKIRSTLEESVADQQKTIIENVQKNFEKSSKEIEKKISDYFNIMEEGLASFNAAMLKTQKTLISINTKLNMAFAKRVIDWVQCQRTSLTEESIKRVIQSVERKVGKEITITTMIPVNSKKLEEEIKSVLQEDLFIKISS